MYVGNTIPQFELMAFGIQAFEKSLGLGSW